MRSQVLNITEWVYKIDYIDSLHASKAGSKLFKELVEEPLVYLPSLVNWPDGFRSTSNKIQQCNFICMVHIQGIDPISRFLKPLSV